MFRKSLFLFAVAFIVRFSFAGSNEANDTHRPDCPAIPFSIAEPTAQLKSRLVEAGLLSPYSFDALEKMSIDEVAPESIVGPFYMPEKIVFGGGGHYFHTNKRKMKNDYVYIEVVDLLGRRIYFRTQKQGKKRPGNITYIRIKPEESIFKDEPLDVSVLKRDYSMPPDKAILAKTLATNQLSSSSSWNAAKPDEKAAMQKALEEVYIEALELVEKGEPLTVPILSKWNRKIFESTPIEKKTLPPGSPPLEQINHLMSGIVIGTQEDRTYNGKLYRVDTAGADVTVSISGQMTAATTPSDLVPAKLEAIVGDMNKINDTTSPIDIVAFNKRLYRCHPYLDANGRLGRVLLDIGLIKAKFPPAPAKLKSAELGIFQSNEDATRELINSYQP